MSISRALIVAFAAGGVAVCAHALGASQGVCVFVAVCALALADYGIVLARDEVEFE